MKNTFIISLGGSIVVPGNEINWKFLKNFRRFIIKHITAKKRFFIVVGGGATARNYIAAADNIVRVADEDRDWLGIHSTRLNAHLLRTIFRDVAYPKIIKNPMERFFFDSYKIIIASGWKPGWSTDYVAVTLAKKYKIKKIINLSNINYVSDSDPRINKFAKKLIHVSWKDFRKLVGNEWTPGMSAPFDPIASRQAEKLNLEVIVMNGYNLSNLEKYFKGNQYKGTIIKNRK